MARYRLMVFTNPVEGQEDEFNDWYTNQHLPDLLKVPGVVSAERWGMRPGGAFGWRYIAIYELETEDPEGVVAELRKRTASGEIFMSPALGKDLVSGIFSHIASKP